MGSDMFNPHGPPPKWGPSDEELFPEVHKPKPDPYLYTEDVFDLRELAYSQMFSKGLIDAKLVDVPDVMRGSFMAELRATMMGKKVPPHTVTESRPIAIDVPASPWQHFKQAHEGSWWLRWLVRRRPVRTRPVTHTATLTATWEQFVGFPWQEVVDRYTTHDRLGPAVRFAQVDRDMTVTRD